MGQNFAMLVLLFRRFRIRGERSYSVFESSVSPAEPDLVLFKPSLCHALVAEKLRSPLEVSRSEEHTSELQSHLNLVCRLLLEKKKNKNTRYNTNITSTSIGMNYTV